jgi:PAS domain S-box-containing protein
MLEAIAAQVGGLLARFWTNEALKESEGQYRLLAENISDVIWTVDIETGGLRYVSPSIRNLTGFTPGEVMQMPVSELVSPETLEKAQGLFESQIGAVKSGAFEPITVEMGLLAKDGGVISTESRMSAVYAADGTPLYLLGLTRDVSERRRLEEQLRQSAKMQAIGELAGGVAHEFNNMLTGILGYANMLRLTAEPGTSVHESARTIEKAAERAADLTRKLLGFARRGRQRRESVDLNGVIREVVSLLRQTISETIHVSCEMNVEDLVVIGDSGQLEQVLLNLALNARDAMPSGGDLAFATGIAELTESGNIPEPDVKPGRFAFVTVADTGSGITQEDMHRIFEPFFTTKGQGRGTGMGLAMVYGTVRNHGGFTTVESKPGEGSTFKVYIPLDSCEVPEEPAPVAEPSAHSGTGRILVVDDEDLVRDVARSMLEICGYEVVTVSTGQEAVDYYRDHGDGIDLVLIDMVMPEMSGRDCFRALKEMDPDVRAVLSTGYGANGEARDIVQEGMAGLVLKPFSKGALGATIREALSEEAVPLR